jgi:hypothetical protein
MTSADARAPSNRPRASTRMDLPAPVSPVRRFSPSPNSISRARTTATFSILRTFSMRERAPVEGSF